MTEMERISDLNTRMRSVIEERCYFAFTCVV